MGVNLARREDLQNRFLSALYFTRYNFAAACKLTSIQRSTVYNWRRDDPEFEAKVQQILTALSEDCAAVIFNAALGRIDSEGQAIGPQDVDIAMWLVDRLSRRVSMQSPRGGGNGDDASSLLQVPQKIEIVRASDVK